MADDLQNMANEFMRAAIELEQAAKHCKIASLHFEKNRVPRACAHAFASEGHILKAKKIIDQRAEFHSEKANTHFLENLNL